ncbi:MAG: DUF938 domain-containing protein [Sulfuricellaceae bacterium]|nr:DUF938 domain-containing protein [Sulfuricellaceae bacterium]
MKPEKPYSESCEQNQGPILKVLREVFGQTRRVLEIGSGSGQHAVHFGRGLPHLHWQPSEVPAHLPGIRLWLQEAALDNVAEPLALDVTLGPWPETPFDGIFSANTVHIMAWPAVQQAFCGIGRSLAPGGLFCLYGPFNYDRRFTSESNARFDLWLKQRDPASGVRDFADLDRLAKTAGLEHVSDIEMPANNRCLVWRKKTAA